MIGTIIAKKAVRSAFNSLNNGNIEKFIKDWGENVEFTYPGRVMAGGIFKGKYEVKKWFEKLVKQFPRIKFTIIHMGAENIFDLVGNNTVFVCFELILTNKDGFTTTNSGITMIKIERGKVTRVEEFLRIIDGDEYRKGWGDK